MTCPSCGEYAGSCPGGHDPDQERAEAAHAAWAHQELVVREGVCRCVECAANPFVTMGRIECLRQRAKDVEELLYGPTSGPLVALPFGEYHRLRALKTDLERQAIELEVQIRRDEAISFLRRQEAT